MISFGLWRKYERADPGLQAPRDTDYTDRHACLELDWCKFVQFVSALYQSRIRGRKQAATAAGRNRKPAYSKAAR